MENLENNVKAKVFALAFAEKGTFVGDCAQPTYKDTVHKHLTGKKGLTRAAAQWCKENDVEPELYELGVVAAGNSVLQHKAAHVRWLLDQGQTVMVSDTVMAMARELDVDADPVYRVIKNKTIDEAFAPGKNLIRGRRTAAERRRTAGDGAKKYAMSVEVTPVMRKKIEEEAANRGMSMMAYVRECIASDGGATMDMKPLIELTDRLISCSNTLGALRDTVAATGIADATVVSALQDTRQEFAGCCTDVQRELRKVCSRIKSHK